MSKIIVALDNMSQQEAITLARQLRDHVWGFKIHSLLLECGVTMISLLKAYGHVMADRKASDIPSVVADFVKRCEGAGGDIITVHSTSGLSTLRAAAEAATKINVIAITVLTSMSDEECVEIYGKPRDQVVYTLSQVGLKAGVAGFVCAAADLDYLVELQGKYKIPSMLKVMTGVRLKGLLSKDDQVHTGRPDDRADLLVVGREITAATDPLAVATEINQILG